MTMAGQGALFENAYKKKSNEVKIYEDEIQLLICDFLNSEYPDVVFTSDQSGLRVSIGLAKRIHRGHCNQFKLPDLIILEPRGQYKGMVLEIKTDRDKVLKKNGEFKKDEHVEKQLETLKHLHSKGYYAAFGLGYEDSIRKITKYLGDAATNNNTR